MPKIIILESILSSLFSKKKSTAPNKNIYIPYLDTFNSQDSDQSIVTSDGKYDMVNFSQHEIDTIKSVVYEVNRKYPIEYRSIGFVNEAECAKYKARYILFEMIIEIYGSSTDPVDQFACALAFESKGARCRKASLEMIEKSIDSISPDFMSMFLSCQPLNVYSKISSMYEKEHEYDKAIHYCTLAKSAGGAKDFFDKKIRSLTEKSSKPIRKRKYIPKQEDIDFDNKVKRAANYFIRLTNIKGET